MKAICAICQRENDSLRGMYGMWLCGACYPAAGRLCLLLLETIDHSAQNDMLVGNPIEGAHHRQIQREQNALRLVVAKTQGGGS